MPESKVRKPAKAKKASGKPAKKAPAVKKVEAEKLETEKLKAEADTPEGIEAARKAEAKAERHRRLAVDRSWVPWVFVPLLVIGVLWLVVYYIAGMNIPFMAALGDWNILIGMGCMAGAFAVATLWK
ncbi:cell division protein CrgA [Acidipropionibacterium thoenii]|uniref:cell division protein CrgA n=1 Tax=Acidipropionibacterium thoenii TaxID=1751 RepID=UPI0003FB6E4C